MNPTHPPRRYKLAALLSIYAASLIIQPTASAQLPKHPGAGQKTALVEPIATTNHIAIKAAQQLYFTDEQLTGQPFTEFATRYSTFTPSDTPAWLRQAIAPRSRGTDRLPGDTIYHTYGWPWQGQFGYSWWAWWEFEPDASVLL